ncbi:MAG: ferritin-like protein [Myxococcales bacterium]|nr:ferritin-like protein [Myxococcales bacterium]
MIRIKARPASTVVELRERLQQAVELEFATLPPYLYALYSIPPGQNQAAVERIKDIVHEEMIHMCLACNMLNAIGGRPLIADQKSVPSYPGPLPYDIGSEDGKLFEVSMLPFSKAAMAQAMRIEEPEDPLVIKAKAAAAVVPEFQTIGEFYQAVDQGLSRLPKEAFSARPRNQLGDQAFFMGELFAVTCYEDAHRAITRIVSQGEGSSQSPVDFEGDLAHFYRFSEIERNQVLAKADNEQGYAWGEPLGVDWEAVFPAVADPASHEAALVNDAAAIQLQDDCDQAFTRMLVNLQRAIDGEPGRLGNSVRFMFELRMASIAAFSHPVEGLDKAVGPAFRFRSELA